MTWAPDYATSAALKTYLRIEDAVDDAQVASAITAASRAVDNHCRRQFGSVAAPELRQYSAVRMRGHGGSLAVPIDDLMTVTGLAVTVAALPVVPVSYWPLNAAQGGEPWTRLYLPAGTSCGAGAVSITAKWGWTTVPPTVATATILQAARIFKRQDAPFGVAGSPELGSELRLLAKVDPDVAVMLRKYVRRAGVA